MKATTRVFLGVALALAIVLAATIEVAAQGKKPGGGGGESCNDLNVSVWLRDAADDSVKSDLSGSYPAKLNCNNETNNLYLLTESGRGMVFTVGTVVATGVVSASLGASIADDGGILAMEEGTSKQLTKVQFAFQSGDWKYQLSWGTNYPGTSTIYVTRTTTTQWVIETSPEPNNEARLRKCPAKGTCRSPEESLHGAPVRMEINAL